MFLDNDKFYGYHSYKICENCLVWGTLTFQPFGILLKGFYFLEYFSKKEGFLNRTVV
jgi:hypothetical protein